MVKKTISLRIDEGLYKRMEEVREQINMSQLAGEVIEAEVDYMLKIKAAKDNDKHIERLKKERSEVTGKWEKKGQMYAAENAAELLSYEDFTHLDDYHSVAAIHFNEYEPNDGVQAAIDDGVRDCEVPAQFISYFSNGFIGGAVDVWNAIADQVEG